MGAIYTVVNGKPVATDRCTWTRNEFDHTLTQLATIAPDIHERLLTDATIEVADYDTGYRHVHQIDYTTAQRWVHERRDRYIIGNVEFTYLTTDEYRLDDLWTSGDLVEPTSWN